MSLQTLIEQLNHPLKENRLEALREIKKRTDSGEFEAPKKTQYVNNHIHTTYSFSPYSPTKALYMAWQNGLSTAGIMDHDSLGGAHEFIEAAEILDMPVTVGMECRIKMHNTRLLGKRINNPDQISVAYAAIHGIPHQNIDKLNAFFEKYRQHRNERNKKMCQNISNLIAPYGLTLDFEKDVLPLSLSHETGSVTERHILYALALKVTEKYTTPASVVDFLKNDMGIALSSKVEAQILAGDETPEFYKYDILGALKSNMVEKFYIDATDECPDVTEYISIVHECGAIAAYAYLGDVGNSVTGDKKAQKFEDDYLDLLIEVLKEYKFDAITYMPTRNTKEQLTRLMGYCEKEGFFQISGEDINSPRQKFICEALNDPDFAHLVEATYALIGHENAATENIENSMFSESTVSKYPDIKERVKYFSKL